MAHVLRSSSIFAGCDEPSVTASVSASAYIDWKLRPAAPQRYRGAVDAAAALPSRCQRTQSEREAVHVEIGALTSRVAALQTEIAKRAPTQGGAVNTAVATLLARLNTLGLAADVTNSDLEMVPATPMSSTDGHCDSFDSFAKHSSEQSRVRGSGRLGFGSDYHKIA